MTFIMLKIEKNWMLHNKLTHTVKQKPFRKH